MSAREASQATQEPTSAAPGGVHPEVHDDHHPSPRQYVNIAVVLAILTAMEVSLFYIEVGGAFIPSLLILMLIKFAMVVGWFMHLRFDTRLYTRMLVAGLVGAGVLYLVVLLTFLNTEAF